MGLFSVFGMSEEVIPFVLIFIPLSMALGYDSIIGTFTRDSYSRFTMGSFLIEWPIR